MTTYTLDESAIVNGHELDELLDNIKQLLDAPEALNWLHYNSLLYKHDERIVLECSDYKLEAVQTDKGSWVLNMYEMNESLECSDYISVMQVDLNEGTAAIKLYKSKLFNSLTARQYMTVLTERIKLLWLYLQPAKFYLEKLKEFLTLL